MSLPSKYYSTSSGLDLLTGDVRKPKLVTASIMMMSFKVVQREFPIPAATSLMEQP